LGDDHQVTFIESCPRLARSCAHQDGGQKGDQPVDTGFIGVLNYANYPNLAALFKETGRARG